jgi:hypothetical protein
MKFGNPASGLILVKQMLQPVAKPKLHMESFAHRESFRPENDP